VIRRQARSNRNNVDDGSLDALRKLSIGDDAYVESLLADEVANIRASGFDGKTHALVQLGALVAIDCATPSYHTTVEEARRYGATADEIVAVLIAVMPAIGAARVVSAAPKLGLILGYDVAAALEELDEDNHRSRLFESQ
jgi:alkylhydroperoxidase/carboxymuconolactone decarboxylase family protein YurZ